HDDQHRLRRTYDTAITRAERAERRAEQIESVLDQIADTRGDRFSMAVGGHHHTKRVAAGEHLQRILGEQLDNTPPESTGPVLEVGTLAGLRIKGQTITT